MTLTAFEVTVPADTGGRGPHGRRRESARRSPPRPPTDGAAAPGTAEPSAAPSASSPRPRPLPPGRQGTGPHRKPTLIRRVLAPQGAARRSVRQPGQGSIIAWHTDGRGVRRRSPAPTTLRLAALRPSLTLTPVLPSPQPYERQPTARCARRSCPPPPRAGRLPADPGPVREVEREARRRRTCRRPIWHP